MADTRAGHETPERYVDRRELAALLGVSVSTVDRLVKEGMPSVTWGRRTRRFKPSVAIAWASDPRRTPITHTLLTVDQDQSDREDT